MFWGVTCTHRIFWFQKIKQWLIRTVRQLNCLNCPVPFLLRQVCAQHVSLERAPNCSFSEVPRAPRCGKPRQAAGSHPLETPHLRSSQKKHGEAHMPQTTIQGGQFLLCPETTSSTHSKPKPKPFQKVFHMKNTISKFVFTFPVLIVPSFLLLTDCNFPRFLLKFFP